MAARYNWCQGPVPGRGPAFKKHWFKGLTSAPSESECSGTLLGPFTRRELTLWAGEWVDFSLHVLKQTTCREPNPDCPCCSLVNVRLWTRQTHVALTTFRPTGAAACSVTGKRKHVRAMTRSGDPAGCCCHSPNDVLCLLTPTFPNFFLPIKLSERRFVCVCFRHVFHVSLLSASRWQQQGKPPPRGQFLAQHPLLKHAQYPLFP